MTKTAKDEREDDSATPLLANVSSLPLRLPGSAYSTSLGVRAFTPRPLVRLQLSRGAQRGAHGRAQNHSPNGGALFCGVMLCVSARRTTRARKRLRTRTSNNEEARKEKTTRALLAPPFLPPPHFPFLRIPEASTSSPRPCLAPIHRLQCVAKVLIRNMKKMGSEAHLGLTALVPDPPLRHYCFSTILQRCDASTRRAA
ncbi:hypothetical protein B0H12DRAFT_1232966 [Mycena haematopus]|nr:hypothetical protein B0H12DRAFT_1232966 [Mycena haematopus]